MNKFLLSITLFFTCLFSFSQNDLLINAGGPEVNYNDQTFIADNYFNTGSTLDRPQTGLPEPYQSFRYSRSQQMSYDIPLEDGEYVVNLYFAELWFGATGGGSGGVGSRVFDVTIEEALAEDNLDIFAEVGADAMLVRTHTVTVTGGVLNIDFDSRDAVGGERHPVINAIEILGQTTEPVERPFVTTWKTDNPGVSEDDQITIPTFPGETYNYTVDWGDGTSDSGVTEDITHTYQTVGTYEVSISGDFPRIFFEFSDLLKPTDRKKILSVNQWGDIEWKSMDLAFAGCSHLDVVAVDTPNLQSVNILSRMFYECESLIFNSSINEWDTSSIQQMLGVFEGAKLFNQPIGKWNVENVFETTIMFGGAENFNQDLSSWNVSNVVHMGAMFQLAFSFNSPIESWDVGNVIEMRTMFSGANSFNQNIGNWNVSSVADMTNMFNGAGLSPENYDNLLNSWSTQQPQNGVIFDAGNSQYCLGEAARQKLIDDFGWTITDGGKAADCVDTTSFITTWKTDNLGLSEDNQITIPTFSDETYNYSVDWGDGTSDSEVTGDITHTYASPGTYQVSISGDFPRIRLNFSNDSNKLLEINQWGDIEWESMSGAFAECANMDVKAIDAPNLTNVSSLSAMFYGCYALVGNNSFNSWDVSNITNMNSLFSESSFNSDISSWDVSNVTDMSSTFGFSVFNQDISDWNVSNVTQMGGMFGFSSFNQDISDWNVSIVTNMNQMFMESNFDQDISSWDVSNVTQMGSMFSNSVFDQDLGNWNISNVLFMNDMFNNAGLSLANFDSTLEGWGTQQVQSGVAFDAGNSQYCLGEEARQKLIDDFGWTITDAGKSADCIDTTSFITTWKTDNPGESADNEITIPTVLDETYNYTVNWGDGTSDLGVTGNITHTYETPGTYQVSISGEFPRILFPNAVDHQKIISVDQWGAIEWNSMNTAFASCVNLEVLASDVPDLSNVTSLKSMFSMCSSMSGNGSFGLWDVSNIESMASMFEHSTFNQNISLWNVSKVTDMSGMFSNAVNFNQDIRDWDTSSVINMGAMFSGASSFNNDLSGWDVGKVTNMGGMFLLTSFNYDISAWDVSNVTDMNAMFALNQEFDQDISSWAVGQVEFMNDMFFQTALATENYDSILQGWSMQQLQDGVIFDAGNSQYCQGEEARQKLIDDFGWTITDGGKSADCIDTTSFITTWKTDNPGVSEDNQITIPTFDGEVYNYSVDWGDGTSDSGVTGDITHTYETVGTYQVSIAGVFPRIYFFNGETEKDNNKLLEINQWGQVEWSSMRSAFYECENMDMLATDVPNLTNVNSIGFMFDGCTNFVANNSIEDWDTSTITDMSGVFKGTEFNQNIGNWNTSLAETMDAMFYYATSFNQDIGEWDVSTVNAMVQMFEGAESFNQDISGWDVSNVTIMWDTFYGASSFNQNLANWDVSNVGTFIAFLDNSGLSDENYNNMLIGWSELPSLKNNITLQTNQSQFCAAKEARQFIIDTYGWTIEDAGESANCESIPDFALRINTGGTEVIYSGETFSIDTYFNTGNTLDRPQTGLPEPYQSFRFSRSQQMSYDIPLEDGEYTVNLYFAELWFGATGGGSGGVGSRIFDVNIEGQLAEDNLDVFKEVGADAMLMKSHTVTVTDGILNIDFNSTDAVGGERHPIINAIEILGQVPEPVERPFITTWKTDNPGSSADNQITIPTSDEFDYDYRVDWGDGTSDDGVNGDITHTYSLPGTYQVSISGNFPQIKFLDKGDKEKILFVDQWGDIEWSSMFHAFSGCSNLDVLAIDTPNLGDFAHLQYLFYQCNSLIGNESFADWNTSNVPAMSFTFWGADQFNQDISAWDVSKVRSMRGMFQDASSFNQNLNDWNVLNVTDFTRVFYKAASFNQNLKDWNISNAFALDNIFDQTSLSTDNYDEILIGWSVISQNELGIPIGLSLGAANTAYCEGEEARQKLINDFGWSIVDGGKASDCLDTTSFITTWKTDNPGASEDNQITIPTYLGETYNYSIEWGDGTSDSEVTGNITHTYATPGTYQVSISGNFPGIHFNTSEADKEKLELINQWGDIVWRKMNSSYEGCSNLDVNAMDAPNLLGVSTLNGTFTNCTSLIGNNSFNSWNLADIVEIENLFAGASLFNQPLDQWNVGSVIDMTGTFSGASSFNQPLSTWEVGKVEEMWDMFGNATSFNQNIEDWDVSSVLDFTGMFASASSFNQNLENWDISNASSMEFMFNGSALSQENYDNILISWSQNPSLLNNVSLGASDTNYCLGEAARQKLIDDFGWTITDGGKAFDCPDPNDFAIRINTGGPQVIWSGDTFMADQYRTGGAVYAVDFPISDTTNDELYQTEVYGPAVGPFTYEIPIETPGEYNIRLHFAELYFGVRSGGLGSRVFNVSIEGNVVLSNFDILNEVSPATALIKEFNNVQVSDGFATIEFTGVTQRAKISGIEILGTGPQEERPFVTTWKTDNPGTSTDNEITIPTFSGETYNYIVDWGDGTSDSGVTGDITHAYVSPGEYQVSISGDFPRIAFNNNNDAKKIVAINQWGDIEWKSMDSAFVTCRNMQLLANDAPDLSKVTSLRFMFAFAELMNSDLSGWDVSNITDMASMFSGARSFNQDISVWNVSNVTNMSFMFNMAEKFNQNIGIWDVSNVTRIPGMFLNASSFNQNLENWNVENVTTMAQIFINSGLSNENYDNTLISWSQLPSLINDVPMDAPQNQYCISEQARQKLIDDFGWIITDAGKAADCQPFSNDEFWLEAECANVGENWSTINSANASGGQYLLSPAGANYNSAPTDPESTIRFDFDAEAGIYKIYARVSVPSEEDDSFWVRVNDGSWLRWNLIPGSADFSWHQVHDRENNTVFLTFDLVDGANTIEIAHREDGAGLDKLYVTRIPNIPTGFGATDETCNSGISGKRAVVETNPATLTPNPVLTTTTLSFEKPVQLTEIQVFDVTGRLAHTYNGKDVFDDGAYLLNVNALPAGTYFINSVDVNGVKHQKQMVIKK
ncbi:BspA family leucine-rich repeat surface protein [Maribacter sp. 2308TA10-17]|uniref:BspA family leucine-rich repeat surface protein n=1 Tax=Maribacter sp. 2308TA10-17 TaxID=3386276 RepID=UPI0039BC42B8